MLQNIRDLIAIFKHGGLFNYLHFRMCVNDPAMHKAVAELNKSVKENEKHLQKISDRKVKLHRYRLIDWFIS